MVAQLGARAVLLAAAIAMVFFGIGLIGVAIATVLAPYCGTAGSYAVAGAILLSPPLIWAAAVLSAAPRRQPSAPSGGGRVLMNALFAAVAKETPWMAVAGAGLVGVVNLFLNRNKPQK